MNNENIKAVLRTYRLDLSKPHERAEYDRIVAGLQARGIRKFDVMAETFPTRKGAISTTAPELNGREIEIETEHLFDNQWNTAPIDGYSENGLRIFDWYEEGFPNRHIKYGHYLEPNDELVFVRNNTTKCGYCGWQDNRPGSMLQVGADYFHKDCLDSEYLEQGSLPLLRMRKISDTSRREPLSEAELAQLLPIYREAQLHGLSERGKARIAKAKADVAAKYERTVHNAAIERDGRLWILGTLPGLDGNAIYYSHTGRWGFGWRSPINDTVLGELLDKISEFPYPYDITCTGGKTLSGER